MRKILSILAIVPALCVSSQSSESFYNVISGEGNGIRFWSNDSYKMHMGSSSVYKYGPVTDYSIKTNMSNTPGRGWTWGPNGGQPVAALNIDGEMKIKGYFEAGSIYAPILGTRKTSYTQIQLATHDWSGSHAILFNAYKSINVNGALNTVGNTKYSNNQGNYGGGAGGLFFNANGGTMDILISPSSGAIGIDTNVQWGTPKLRINKSGEVGIGTTDTDGYKLSVAGNIRATEIKVEATPWPDYVFESDYNLRTLAETEEYIKVNKHLPEIPSAKEMEANGVELGEMNMLLLKKIEELTLYVLELEKKNLKQDEKIEEILKTQRYD